MYVNINKHARLFIYFIYYMYFIYFIYIIYRHIYIYIQTQNMEGKKNGLEWDPYL